MLANIHAFFMEHRDRYPPGSDLRKAIDYLVTRWECFTVYTTRGDLPIDNSEWDASTAGGSRLASAIQTG